MALLLLPAIPFSMQIQVTVNDCIINNFNPIFFRITVFEDVNDDLYDGGLDADDEELPGALINFFI